MGRSSSKSVCESFLIKGEMSSDVLKIVGAFIQYFTKLKAI